MCYPYPGPQCEVQLYKSLAHISKEINSMRSDTDNYTSYIHEVASYTDWASTLRGQDELSKAISAMNRYPASNRIIINHYIEMLDKGKNLRHQKIDNYHECVLSFANKIFSQMDSLEQIPIIIKQLSSFEGGKEHIQEILNSRFKNRKAKKYLRAYKESYQDRIQKIIQKAYELENNKELIGVTTEDYKGEMSYIQSEYNNIIQECGALLDSSERSHLDFIVSRIGISLYDYLDDSSDFMCLSVSNIETFNENIENDTSQENIYPTVSRDFNAIKTSASPAKPWIEESKQRRRRIQRDDEIELERRRSIVEGVHQEIVIIDSPAEKRRRAVDKSLRDALIARQINALNEEKEKQEQLSKKNEETKNDSTHISDMFLWS